MPARVHALVIAVVLCVAAFTPGAARAVRVRVDGTVASITIGNADSPSRVLFSDLELRARLRVAAEPSIEAPERVTLDDALLRDAFREAVSETLLYAEAQRVQVAPPTPIMVDAEWRRFLTTVGGAARLDRVRRAMGATEEEIGVIVEQRAWIAAFLEANLRGEGDVDADTVERVFAAGDHPFTGLALEQAREPLRAWIRASYVSDAVRSWVDALRGRARVEISPAWAPLLDHPFDVADE